MTFKPVVTSEREQRHLRGFFKTLLHGASGGSKPKVRMLLHSGMEFASCVR